MASKGSNVGIETGISLFFLSLLSLGIAALLKIPMGFRFLSVPFILMILATFLVWLFGVY